MPDIIKLLPDSVANQIAAGEVIQRPASAVKELMENAVDSGASSIRLIVKDAGKALIQVIDNGCGMSDTDARLSFARHATSKIRKAEDLWTIRTKGFRGEALASIAAVAQVELKTRRTEDELGTLIEIEGTEVVKQEPVQCAAGTSISMRNLFYNIPARRNFLKSNLTETRQIFEEFTRIALAHPELSFQLINNGLDVHQLPIASLRQRIVALTGANFNEVIVPLSEETSILNIHGYIGKPEFAKKTRGEQYLFVNNRFIRDPYLNHAIVNAYEEMLPHGTFPAYFIFIEIDPSKIDINIHPTKTEIKFEDEKSVYAIIRSAVKHSLGQYSITPSLEFNVENSFPIPILQKDSVMPPPPSIRVNPDYNPFSPEYTKISTRQEDWKRHFNAVPKSNLSSNEIPLEPVSNFAQEEKLEWEFVHQIAKRFILCSSSNGFMLIDQNAASERVLYEKFLKDLNRNKSAVQQNLFPKSIDFSAEHTAILNEILPELNAVGFEIRPFGKNSFVVHGVPADLTNADSEEMIHDVIDQFVNSEHDPVLDKREKLAKTLAKSASIKSGSEMTKTSMIDLLNALMLCEKKTHDANGNAVFVLLRIEDIERLLRK